jgi:putative spermidine/putrescine transport system substrate-binding protein
MLGSTTRRMLFGAAALMALVASGSVGATAEELRILAWQGYADDDWVAEFEKQTGANVSVVYAQTDDEIWSKVKGSEGEDFDLFAVNTSELQRYIDAGLAAPHDVANLPNQQHTLPQFRDLAQVRGVSRDGKVYGIPFAFDSIGLIYDTTKVSPPPDSMNVLWDPAYKGKILLYDASAHNFSFAALAEGIENPFNLSDAQLAEIKQKLIALQANALSYYQSADEALQIYNSNDVALIFANFGQQQLKQMKAAGAPIAYVVPKEGALAWLDTWVVSKGAKNPELAEKWVDFVLQQKISGALTERTGFGNTVTPLASAGKDDKFVWLLPVEDFQKRNDLWNEVKAAGR